MARRHVVRTTIVALVTAAAGLIASPAYAGPACPAGQPCFWDDANRGGNWVFSGFNNWVGNGANDRASSFENKASRNAVWYWDINCGGNVAMILGSGAFQNASWFNNDETSSVCTS